MAELWIPGPRVWTPKPSRRNFLISLSAGLVGAAILKPTPACLNAQQGPNLIYELGFWEAMPGQSWQWQLISRYLTDPHHWSPFPTAREIAADRCNFTPLTENHSRS